MNEVSTAILKFKKLSKHAYRPTKATPFSAGYDLYSAYDYIISGGEKELVLIDIAIEIPEGCYGRIAPRSGLAWNSHIDVGAGVIDYDFRGNVAVVLFNLSDSTFIVKKGDRIAQLICEKISYPEIIEIEELNTTDRGALGFGSTDSNNIHHGSLGFDSTQSNDIQEESQSVC